jgi:hypothetical protein
MADFVKPWTHLQLKVGGFDQLEDEPIDEYEIESDKDMKGQVQTSDGNKITDESSEDIVKDWRNQIEEISEYRN